MKTFPNGVTCYLETHFELASKIAIEFQKDDAGGQVKERHQQQGYGGLYELAEDWADEFEKLNADREWDGEFFEEIEEFFIMKNKE